MIHDDKTITLLFKTLNETRAARKKAQLRLEQLEHESRQLRGQIDEAEAAIQRVQFVLQSLIGEAITPTPAERKVNRASQPETQYSLESRPEYIPKPRGNRAVKPPVLSEVEVKSARLAELNIPQAAIIILREAGGPLHVNELYNRMLENGFQFGGENHLISLSVSLSRNSRFRKVGPGTFDLVIRDAGQVA